MILWILSTKTIIVLRKKRIISVLGKIELRTKKKEVTNQKPERKRRTVTKGSFDFKYPKLAKENIHSLKLFLLHPSIHPIHSLSNLFFHFSHSIFILSSFSDLFLSLTSDSLQGFCILDSFYVKVKRISSSISPNVFSSPSISFSLRFSIF